MPSYPSENHLLRACRRGDRQAQFKLYQQFKVYLFGICMRYGKSREEAEDILQEGFYRILKDLKQYRGQGPLQAWMRKVMVNTALMHLRKFHKINYTFLEKEVVENTLPADTTLQYSDRANAIIQLIQSLPLVQQTVFNLRAIDGYSFKEIAQQTGAKEATLRSHYLRARTKLQSLLRKELNNDG